MLSKHGVFKKLEAVLQSKWYYTSTSEVIRETLRYVNVLLGTYLLFELKHFKIVILAVKSYAAGYRLALIDNDIYGFDHTYLI